MRSSARFDMPSRASPRSAAYNSTFDWYEELEVELHRVGLQTELSTFDLEAENYMVVASKV